MPVGDISPIGIVKVPKSLVASMTRWVSTGHANFMSGSHRQTGAERLHFYTTAHAPVLNVAKDLESGAVDDGSEWVVWTEYYANRSGLLDHWKKGSESGMLPEFMAMTTMGGGTAEASFVQPLTVLHEVNHLLPTAAKPRAALSNLAGASQLLVKFTVPKEHIPEAETMIAMHAAWMTDLHGKKRTMLGRDIVFAADEELLYYSVASCPVLVNPMDLESGDDPEGSRIFVIIEYYKTKKGLEKQWVHAKEMNEAKGPDFTLAQMSALEEKGMDTLFLQPLEVKASINWFGLAEE